MSASADMTFSSFEEEGEFKKEEKDIQLPWITALCNIFRFLLKKKKKRLLTLTSGRHVTFYYHILNIAYWFSIRNTSLTAVAKHLSV